jgi:hypothetical protein
MLFNTLQFAIFFYYCIFALSYFKPQVAKPHALSGKLHILRCLGLEIPIAVVYIYNP